MVVIRLARGGSKKRPFYNITVATDSAIHAMVASMNVSVSTILQLPVRQFVCLSMKPTSTSWIANGAKMSETVSRLYKRIQENSCSCRLIETFKTY